MSSPLDGCWAKIERANDHIKKLDADLSAFLAANPHRVVGQLNDDRTEYFFTAFGPARPPLVFAVIAGEVIHHLRSSLDHLVWALVLQRHQSPTFRVQFPICKTVAEYKKAIKGHIIKRVSSTAQTIIQGLQPYGRDHPEDHLLAILQHLSNTEKHKLLLIVSSSTAMAKELQFSSGLEILNSTDIAEIIPGQWGGRIVGAVEGGAEMLRIRFVRPITHVEVDAEFTPQIALEPFGRTQFKPVIAGLVELRDAVTKTIKLFAGEFCAGRASAL